MTVEVANPSREGQAFTNSPGQLGILDGRRLQVYGYAVAAVYALFLVSVYRAGTWIISSGGLPIYTDFACAWTATVQALHGDAASLYDPAEFVKVQAALVGSRDYFYPNWPYPPTFLLILAPFTVLPYLFSFVTWDLITLLGLIVVVYLIVRRPPAIALVLASPLVLERQPVLSGVFIGCLTYKPQFGILLPIALAASRQWRAFGSAAATAAMLAAASMASFGAGVWAAFPRQLVAQSNINFFAGSDSDWGYLQSVYGLIRTLHGGAALACLAQGATALALAILIWIVWRSSIRYSLKAATLSAAALVATPYAFAYDMAALAIPVAFLIRDQMRAGLLRGEKPILVGLFGVSLAALITFGDRPGGITFGSTPIGALVTIALLGLILKRVLLRQPMLPPMPDTRCSRFAGRAMDTHPQPN